MSQQASKPICFLRVTYAVTMVKQAEEGVSTICSSLPIAHPELPTSSPAYFLLDILEKTESPNSPN